MIMAMITSLLSCSPTHTHILFMLVLFSLHTMPKQATATRSLHGMFAFGSSIVDNGNNNYIATLGKANYLPYGVDFRPPRPTGRFSNGKNVVDLLGDLLRIPLLLPVLDPTAKGSRIRHGVNYGSGGAGILNDTGSVTGMVMNLDQQISKFEEVTLQELEFLLSCTREQILPHYLFFIAAGGNDYQFNYFPNGGSMPNLRNFTENLIAAYSHRLKRLYKLGARKFALLAVNPIGCGPVIRANTPGNRCQSNLNLAARLFNKRLICLVDTLKDQLSGSRFVVINPYYIIMDIIDHPALNGFSNVKSACCELSITGILCKAFGEICSNRNSFAYFDAQHSTEAVSAIIASTAYSSTNITLVYPTNVQQLSQL
ncbi:hypothetical protein Droror1_Dr00027847 [Drosera rotundifolia]